MKVKVIPRRSRQNKFLRRNWMKKTEIILEGDKIVEGNVRYRSKIKDYVGKEGDSGGHLE